MDAHVKTKSTALVIFQSSWGEVDWLLPVLTALAEGGTDVYAYFPNESVYEKGLEYRDLAEKLDQVCRAVFNHARLIEKCSTEKVRGLLNDRERLRNCLGEKCDFIFHDYSGNDFSPYYSAFPEARIFIYPHGTLRYSHAQEQLISVVRTGLNYKSIKPGATLFVGSQDDVPYFKKVAELEDIRVVGYPRFSEEWIASMHRNRPEARGEGLTALLLPIPARKIFHGQSEQLLSTAVKTLLRHNVKVLIRMHPRQERGELEGILKELPSENVSFCSNSVLRAACQADFALSFPSSAIMDCIAAGIPVIEYFDYKDQGWLTFAQKEGKLTSVFRELGLAAAADSEVELDAAVSKLVLNQEARISLHSAQAQALDGLRGPDNGVELILEAMGLRGADTGGAA